MLALIAWLPAAAAEPEPPDADAADKPHVSTTFTNDFELRLQNFDPTPLVQIGGPPPKFVEQLDRLTARASSGRWAANVQVDEVAFVGLPYEVDGQVVHTPPPLILNCGLDQCVQAPFGEHFYANPEKFSVTYDTPDLDVAVGDFYAAFGYGAALNLNRNVDIDVDTSIQGARVVASPGPWEVTALAGMLNRQQVFADNPNIGMLQGDKRHLVGAFRVQRHELGPAAIGLHGVAYDFVDAYGLSGAFDEAFSRTDALVGGGTVELFGVGGVDWQLEGDVLGFPTDEEGHSDLFGGRAPEFGHALYASASFAVGPTIWTVDAKKYRNVNRINGPLAAEQYQAVVPPTLEYERAINFNTAAALTSNDIAGARARVDFALGAVTPYVSVAVFRDADTDNATQHAPAPETIGTVVGGVEALLDDFTVLLNALGRLEQRDDDFGQDRQVYGDVDLKFPLGIGEAHGDLVVSGQRFLGGPEVGGFASDLDWTEASTSLTLAPTPEAGITGYLDYTTNPFALAGGNLGPYNFGALELYVKPSSAWTVKAFYGGYAAGIRCSGGQCRNVPAFTGSRLAVTGTF
ncbi:MAG: hypothetical protein R3F59_14940 [Myxococcota bacterium]